MISMRTNGAALHAARHLRRTEVTRSRALDALSSGLRVRAARDGPAELAISEKLKARLRSTRQAERNALDGMSALQVADAALGETQAVLARMRELAVQAANGTLGSAERAALDAEVQALKREVDRVAVTTEFNGKQLLLKNQFDIAFLVDSSASVGGLIATLKSSVGGFREAFVREGFDVEFGLAEVNSAADALDGVRRLADVGDGSFESQLTSLALAPGNMDPYSALLNASGASDAAGTAEPDAFSWREGSRRLMIYLTDTGREQSLVGTTEADTASAVAAQGVTVHVIGPMSSADDKDGVPGSDLDGLASGTGGTYASVGNGAGSNIPAALDAIVKDLKQVLGPPPIDLQVDIGAASAHQLSTGLPVDSTAAGLGIVGTSVSTVARALDALGELDAAIEAVSSRRASLGASMNRLEATVANLRQRQEGQAAARSRLVDADVAESSAALVKSQLLSQLGVRALAQAHAVQRDAVLALLG